MKDLSSATGGRGSLAVTLESCKAGDSIDLKIPGKLSSYLIEGYCGSFR